MNFEPHAKFKKQLKMITDLNIELKTIKLLEQASEKIFMALGRQRFLRSDFKTMIKS